MYVQSLTVAHRQGLQKMRGAGESASVQKVARLVGVDVRQRDAALERVLLQLLQVVTPVGEAEVAVTSFVRFHPSTHEGRLREKPGVQVR